ncbi:MAG: hypothetical protein H0X16_02600 [Chloroflexi bacterium]|nr:hypothetical protein [Chloroflexota bacterium]
MPTDRQLDQTISRWLEAEAPGPLPDRVLGATFERTRKVRQQGRWRALLARLHMKGFAMNKLVPIGLGAAAVVVALVIGAQLLGTPNGGTGSGASPSPEPTATPEPSVAGSATPEPSAPAAGLELGPFVATGTDDPVQITVNIASSGWVPLPAFDALHKNDDGLDSPEYVGAALLAWAWPAGTGFNVYGDPCQWSTTVPETPATTPDEIAAAFAAQAASDATAPVDVTVGGFAGKAVTLHVPMAYDVPNATREEKFADCDNDVFAFYGVEGESGEVRNAQGAGQVDELWILDVDGSIVILDATYSPATPNELVEELRTLAESATFGN